MQPTVRQLKTLRELRKLADERRPPSTPAAKPATSSRESERGSVHATPAPQPGR